jgi:flagellin
MVFDVKPGTIGSKYVDSVITSSSAEASKSFPPNTIDIGGHGITVTQDARQAVLLSSPITTGTAPAGTITINGQTITVVATDTMDDVIAKINLAGTTPKVNVAAVDGNAIPSMAPADAATAGYTTLGTAANNNRLVFYTTDYGTDATIAITSTNTALEDYLGLTTADVNIKGYDAKANLTYPMTGVSVAINGNQVTVTEGATNTTSPLAYGYAGTTYTDERVTSATSTDASTVENKGIDVTVSVLDAGPMDLQIGANEGQIMSVRIPRVTPETLGVDKVNIGTAAGAQKAIALLDIAINTVSAIRSKLGAYQNRLEHSISNLDTTSENMTESLSRIEDVDMAEEMANYTQKNVLAQAGTSMLAQSNQRPQTILSLLQQ